MGEKEKISDITELKRIVKPASQWYAVYTCSRAEKKVEKRLTEAGINTFLPIQKTIRQWSDRKKVIDKPLISSYLFVKVVPAEFAGIRLTEGVVKIISNEGRPVVIPEEQMINLRILCDSNAEVAISDRVFVKGEMVEVVYGSLAGLKGELIRVGRKHKVVLRILEHGMNLTVDISATAIQKLEQKKKSKR